MKKRFFHRSLFARVIPAWIVTALLFVTGFSGQTWLARAQAPEPPRSTVDDSGSLSRPAARLIPFQVPQGIRAENRLHSIIPTDSSLSCHESAVIQGAITADDALQINRLVRWPDRSSCQAPTGCAGVDIYYPTSPRNYDMYQFANNSTTDQCVTVTLEAANCTGTSFIHSATYLGQYDPSALCVNYLADIGPSPNPNGAYSFIVGPGQTYSVVVNAVDPGALCSAYTLTVTPDCKYSAVYLPLISH